MSNTPESNGGWGEPPAAPYGQPQFGQPTPSPQGSDQPRFGQYGPVPTGQPQYGQPQYGQPGPQGFGSMPRVEAPRPGIIPLRPLSLGEILDGAFNAIRRNAKVMLMMSFAIVTVAVIIGTGLGMLIGPWITSQVGEFNQTSLGASDPSFNVYSNDVLSTTVISYLTLVFASVVSTGVLMSAMGRIVLGHRPSVEEVWAATKRRFPTLLGVTFLSGLIQFLITAIPVGLVFAVAAAGADAAIVVLVAVILGLAAIAGLIWFGVALAFAPAIAVLEGTGVVTSMRRSVTLVRRNFWRTLGILLLNNIILSVVQSIIQMPAAILITFVTINDPTSVWVIVLNALSLVIGSTISVTFTGAVTALLYIDSRMRTEGLDVELTAAARGASGVR